jgi:Domain of unknown function (DUF4838)
MKKWTNKTEGLKRRTFITDTVTIVAGLTFFPGIVSAKWKSTLIGEQLISGASLNLVIIIPAVSSESEQAAADFLQQKLMQFKNSNVTIIKEVDQLPKNAIYIGQTLFAKNKKIAFDQLQEDGYQLCSFGKSVTLVGGAGKGLLYAVYEFLEELGFRKYAPNETFTPGSANYPSELQGKIIHPIVKYRTTSYSDMGDQEYAQWHKLSSRTEWGLFVHTFDTLVPEKKYGASHPEYYSLIDGKRRPGTQLCLSNPDVLNVLITNLRIKIAEKPNAKYWSVSQDDNDQYCRCEQCSALNMRYGGVPSGSIIHFVNQVAKAFPNKTISTLAYWYSRKAPKNILIESNVNIMLCNIESARHAPVFVTDKAFSNDLKDWGALAKDILIWDYNIQFTNFISPFPNLFTIKPNIKFYTDNNVNALFMQANNEKAAEMALLRSYLISKLMWNPDADDQAIMDEFVQGYFGKAGPFIRRYIDRMQTALVESKMSLNIFGDPIDAKESYLSKAMMDEYHQLFDQAEQAVKHDPVLLTRVQTARLPITYATIQIGRTEIGTARSLFQLDTQGVVSPKAEMKKLVEEFVQHCQLAGVKLLRERSGTPTHYLAAYQRIFSNMEAAPRMKSYKKTITPITLPNKASKPVQSLTDGIFASFESWQNTDRNWIFYTGQHMEFILDLGDTTDVNHIHMDFLNPQAQPDWHLMALPKFVSYALSTDGKEYETPLVLNNPHDPNPKTNKDLKEVSIYSFSIDFTTAKKARYIKVHAESLLTTPSWHIRSGKPISIYCDQILVT